MASEKNITMRQYNTFDFVPKFFVATHKYQNRFGFTFFNDNVYMFTNVSSTPTTITATLSGKTLKFYSSKSAAEQLNSKSYTTYWVAFG